MTADIYYIYYVFIYIIETLIKTGYVGKIGVTGRISCDEFYGALTVRLCN